MKRVVLLFFLVVVGAFSQPTIFQRIFTAKQTTGASSVVTNSGQAQHGLFLTFSGPGGNDATCTVAPTVRLEGSYDGTNYVGIGPVSNPVNNGVGAIVAPISFYITGSGMFPYVRANILRASAGCMVDGWYSGTTYPVNERDASMGSLGLIGFSGTTNTAGESTIVIHGPSGTKLTIYGLLVTNTAATANTVNVLCRNSVNSSIDSTLFAWVNSPGNTNLWNWPSSKQGYWQCPNTNDDFNISISASTNVMYWVLYRFE